MFGTIGKGATIIEKHFVDTKRVKGPDISASMDVNELKATSKRIKNNF